MYPERFRVVHQEGIALIRRTGRFLKRHVDHAAAAAGASLLAACASAPESRATSGPPATPASVATQEATSATEAPPTQPPEPTNTPKPAESTATPRPPEQPTRPPFTINTPFPKDRVYDGRVYIEKDGGLRENKGYATFMATLTQELGGVFSYVIDATCPPGSPERQIRSRGNIKVDARSFLNRGFAQKSRFGEQLEGILIREGAVSGDLTFPPHFTEYHPCGIGKVQWATSAKGEGTSDYLGFYVGLFKQAGLREGLTTQEALVEIEKDIGGVKLPQASK
ncbi:TPA: hypothetical protein DD690_01490 [Candidatus Daviesbacteria bacterium]|uniref:Uncharacterized protein n=1 Tax=Candidatus Daviesbacteria bacterium GW2011_GWF2_38_6 TaxID=1618432 RepID=A0A0G0KF64_9BACT|nr:MAG: hypothetical protein US99_C0027G0002 [Candidatus Daviesbacteria bacterium GW2011_GWF2_38_6]OGE27792.1 MAG: hypothetical protein A3D02_02410 [Candidatus Daviesbacteria bacterium RIFCSPHIGHO2_02_FULL_39_41]OGE67329.1 MAG: hypothetical protein A3H81_03905 [Candidatus Daviesbacteria bacterium RIFCSPLOWO2_02_FULL_38_18]OGE73067.1 MAG: hypothetical protein A3H18_00435 [Candidatus Daviesbacteria bacterium RIFCSPLOWO2_12_FULL_38_10]HBQ50637.1 hypothetical protein [Candidatus Daviesbacteria bact